MRQTSRIGGTGRKAFTIHRAVPMHSYTGVSGTQGVKTLCSLHNLLPTHVQKILCIVTTVTMPQRD